MKEKITKNMFTSKLLSNNFEIAQRKKQEHALYFKAMEEYKVQKLLPKP